jgi:hypothetical protein
MATNFERAHPPASGEQPQPKPAVDWSSWIENYFDPMFVEIGKNIDECVAESARKLRIEIEQLRIELERTIAREVDSAIREVRAAVPGLLRAQLLNCGLMKIVRAKDTAVTKASRKKASAS